MKFKHGNIDDDGNCVLGGVPPTMCAGCRDLARRGQQQARPEVFTWDDALDGVTTHGN